MNDEILFKLSLNYLVSGYSTTDKKSPDEIIRVLEEYLEDYKSEYEKQKAA
jgi:hypothetical protein